jgi:hypothetical protein
MRIALLLLITVGSCGRPVRGEPLAGGSPVVIELFTSQGCSSCPPAEELLNQLAHKPGVIALAFHVDYWNRLGWSDPFSSDKWSARQEGYADALKVDTYTPQLVVGGRRAMVGSEGDAVAAAIADESRRPAEGAIELAVAGDTVTVKTRGVKGILRVAFVEDGLTTVIARGENSGRTAKSDAVVRKLVTLEAKPEQTVKLEGTPTRVVAFAQDPVTLAVTTAAMVAAR